MRKKAVLVVDVQVGIFQLPVRLYREEEFLTNIEKLLAKSRKWNIPIVYIQHADLELVHLKKVSPVGEFTPGWLR